MRTFLIFMVAISTTLFGAPKNQERETLLSIVSGDWIAQSLYSAATLDIATHLSEGPKSVSYLAKKTHADEESLYRLLRLLAGQGIFHEWDNRVFSNTPTSELLSSNHPESLRSLILFYSLEMSDAVRNLPVAVKEGTPSFDLTYGEPVFSYFKKNPEAAALFNVAMKEKSAVVIHSCLKAYDFGQFHSVYDIGGGTGHFLQAIMNAHPRVRGLLFDLPEVITAATSSFSSYGKRCALVSGDFFKEIPQDGEAYLLKSVLHDFSDEEALQILKKCRAAMPANAKLLLVEPLITAANQAEYSKSMDVYMMAITGGKERRIEDFRDLLHAAGFRIESVTPSGTEFAILQAKKR